MSLRILRITTAGQHLTSAEAFEHAFIQGVRAPGTEVVTRDISAFLSSSPLIAGRAPRLSRKTLKDEAIRFANAFGGYAVICPDYQHLFVAPYLMTLRNLARCDVSFCVIAHSPGLYAVEWALLARLLTPRDAIVAPTRFARSAIGFLAPGVSRHIRVIGHPIPADFADDAEPADQPPPRIPTLLSLSRIIPTKLIHRQLDALAILAARGRTEIKLQVAGDLHDQATGRLTPYACALKAQTRRLGLDGRVEFLGLVRAVEQRVALFRNASALINLSCTLEESFGKAVAEALCAGRPAVVTRWNGLPETVGSCGKCVDVLRDPRTGNLDVDTVALADAILEVVDAPRAPDRFRRVLERSDPGRVGARYRALWKRLRRGRPTYPPTYDDLTDRQLPAAHGGGLLARTAPLPIMSWRTLFAYYVNDLRSHCASLKLASFPPSSDRSSSDGTAAVPSIRSIVMQGTTQPLERLFAHARPFLPPGPTTHSRTLLPFSTRLHTCTARALDADWTRSSQLACVLATPSPLPMTPRRRRRALDVFDDSSLESIVALARIGAYELAYDRCREGLNPLDDDSHLLVQPLARLAMRLNKPEEAVDTLMEWIRTHPDHFATAALLTDLARLVEAPSLRPETRMRVFVDCLEVLDADDGAYPVMERIRRTVTEHQMSTVFGETRT